MTTLGKMTFRIYCDIIKTKQTQIGKLKSTLFISIKLSFSFWLPERQLNKVEDKLCSQALQLITTCDLGQEK